ncbi:PGAP1-like protein-domain-containing protein [Mrakia frigida]|uniref:Bst1p n=1 Tax=Mrakia frigida TaxID=29902 RepID=UPI003FCBFD02
MPPRLPPLHVLPLLPLALCVLLLSHSLQLHSLQLGRWTCRMSWMSPSYIHMEGLNSTRTPLASKYKLFLYREVGWDGDQTPDGIPVLYIPGNAGSMMQARSIASSAARQYWREPFVRDEEMHSREIRPLDVFTVDFNEDFSAFHGPTLLSQSLFTTHCVEFILSLYSHLPVDSRPTNVILLGHSMGGIVARHSLTFLQDPSQIHTLITLSTPHRLPPVTSDHLIDKVYSDIASYWSPSNLLDPLHPVSNTVLVSICGGSPDPTLPSDSCALSWADVPSSHGLGMFTSGMVGTWTGVDHEAMVWCHQVRWRVARLLLELGGVGRRGGGQEERMDASRDWILGAGRVGVDRSPGESTQDAISIDLASTEHTILDKTARFINPSSTQHHYLFPLPPSSSLRLLSNFLVESVGRHSASTARVYQCQPPSASAETLLSCLRLDPTRLELLPPSPLEGTPFRPNEGVEEREGMTFFEVEGLGAGGWVVVVVEGEGWGVGEVVGSREMLVQTQGLWSLVFGRVKLPSLSDASTLLSRIHLPNALSHSLLVYQISVDHSSSSCSVPPLFLPLLSHQTLTSPLTVTPTTHERAYFPNPSTHQLQSHSASAPFLPLRPDEGFVLELWSDPSSRCEEGGERSEATIRLDLVASASKLVLRYRMTAVAWGVGVVALVLARQVGSFRKSGSFPAFQDTFSETIWTFHIVLPAGLIALSAVQSILVRALACSSPTTSAWFAGLLLGNHHLFFLPLPAISAVVITGLASLLLGVQRGALAVGGWILSVVDRKGTILKLHSPTDPRPSFRPRNLLPIFILLGLVATFIPYQLAFLVSYLIHSLSTLSSTRSASTIPSRTNLYSSVLFLLLWLLPLNAPVLVVWVRNLQVNWMEPFGGDHNVLDIVGILLLVEMFSGGRSLEESSKGRRRIRVLEFSFYALSFASFVFGSRYIHRVYDLANLSLSLVAASLVTIA